MLREIASEIRERWKPLLWTSFAYKLLAVILLTPLVTLPVKAAMYFSGDQVLSDQDIAFFYLTPFGMVGLVAAGALLIGIIALELAALLAILASDPNAGVGAIKAIRFAYLKKIPVLRVTARVVATLLMVTIPFLILAGLAYWWLLSDHDINFYLQQKPAEFRIALAIGVVLVVAWLVLVLRFVTQWFPATGLAVFDSPRSGKLTLRESRERSLGFRRKILFWLIAWILISVLLSVLSAALIIRVFGFVIPGLRNSLAMLVPAIGLALLAWSLVNLLVTLFSQVLFAGIYFRLYQRLTPELEVGLPSFLTNESKVMQTSSGVQITRRRLFAGLLAGAIVVVGLGMLFAETIRTEDDVAIIAHRGSSLAAPENTMAAVRQSIKDGADWVEIDVQETADGEVVVFHDSDFMKMAGNPLKIWDATMEDLDSIDIGSWFNKKFRDERVPTLRQVLHECQGKIRVLIELKYYGHDVDLEKRVAGIVESAEMQSEIEIMSLKADAVRKMKALRPNWRVGFLMSVATGDLSSINADFLAVNASFVDRGFIRRAHRRDQAVLVWTVNDAVSMSSMIGKGVDGIISDVPDLGKLVLQQRAQLNVAERLLLELAEIFGVQPSIVDQ